MRLADADTLSAVVDASPAEYTEVRYHARVLNEVRVVNGRVERARSVTKSGAGIRVLMDGRWGFSSTGVTSRGALLKALDEALRCARARGGDRRVKGLAEARVARGLFMPEVNGRLEDHSIEEKVRVAIEAEREARAHPSGEVRSASSLYRETMDAKIIVNSDGASAEVHDSKPEIVVSAIAGKGSRRISASEGSCVTGGWDDLFRDRDHTAIAREASDKAVRLLGAGQPKGERTTVILDPAMVGLLSHEAIGHLVEADFVLSGSIARDLLGKEVASELVTLVDSGASNIVPYAAGTILVDDEGVMARTVRIIDRGILNSYLHDRESAYIFGVEPTGNARAFEYDDEPLIRMRNTYIEPGDYSLDEMVKEVGHGYMLKGARNGQADANGEFMFGAEEAYLIEHGEVRQVFRSVSISGITMDVLKSIDAVSSSRDFRYDIGTGYCGKYQPMKVDGGGSYVRCTAIVGGVQ
ncbi:MAG: TldD/PmbA family protein [Candidatus Nitrosocaldus sp.]|nr:TldD/PmbA family protein [Candidatus Nitrosocaldus sp.]MDW7999882.1 TldD/PmbA family protein [Candidatus Nitrosocaldus sp.]